MKTIIYNETFDESMARLYKSDDEIEAKNSCIERALNNCGDPIIRLPGCPMDSNSRPEVLVDGLGLVVGIREKPSAIELIYAR